MRDLLVVVLEPGPTHVRAGLAEVDRPGRLLRESSVERGADLVPDVAAVLAGLDAGSLGPRLLALAVAVEPAVAEEATGLLTALTGGGGD